jgi:predicted type IV restriction endonuclease
MNTTVQTVVITHGTCFIYFQHPSPNQEVKAQNATTSNRHDEETELLLVAVHCVNTTTNTVEKIGWLDSSIIELPKEP